MFINEFIKFFQQIFDNFSVDPDDSLNTTKSDGEGNFNIHGQECEVGSIKPYLRITHNCDDGVINPVSLPVFPYLPFI